jgi:hypothetical protein
MPLPVPQRILFILEITTDARNYISCSHININAYLSLLLIQGLTMIGGGLLSILAFAFIGPLSKR